MVRMGMLAALSSYAFEGKVSGLMITASHNLDEDNGAKLMDWRGEMIPQIWEEFASVLANAEENQVAKELLQFAAKFNLKFEEMKMLNSCVFVGCDTRSSSEKLKRIVVEGIESLGAKVVDFGLVTTPQLHWLVRNYNQKPREFEPLDSGNSRIRAGKYFESLADAFHQLTEHKIVVDQKADKPIYVDCANGVGALALCELKKQLKLKKSYLNLELFNTNVERTDLLNFDCGAEHVQKNQSLPTGIKAILDCDTRGYASVDGDADRLVYFYLDAQKQFHLLDGDKIIALAAVLIGDLLKEAELAEHVKIGVIQTAYANGSSTIFVEKELNIPIECVPTGVKHLHHKAADFDIGIYFEANGHGTVLFSEKAVELISSKNNSASRKLELLSKLINQAVGDALSDLLLVECILKLKDWSLENWDSLYSDLPSYQSKVAVKDRNLVQTTDAERKVASPISLQQAIDKLIAQTENGRGFVRPSGTEDVVRIYAEAKTSELARALGTGMENAVKEIIGTK